MFLSGFEFSVDLVTPFLLCSLFSFFAQANAGGRFHKVALCKKWAFWERVENKLFDALQAEETLIDLKKEKRDSRPFLALDLSLNHGNFLPKNTDWDKGTERGFQNNVTTTRTEFSAAPALCSAGQGSCAPQPYLTQCAPTQVTSELLPSFLTHTHVHIHTHSICAIENLPFRHGLVHSIIRAEVESSDCSLKLKWAK